MYKTLMISAGVAAMVVLSGCASTGSGPKTDAQGYPVLEVLSSTPYVWDDSISEALNVARMAQPARVGQGMRDFTDGRQAGVAGRSSTGERVAGGAIMGLGQGLFGVVASEMMIGRVDREMSWRPAIVDFIPKRLLIDNNYSFIFVRDYMARKIAEAVEGDDIKFQKTLTLKNNRIANLSMIAQGEGCYDVMEFMKVDKESDVRLVNVRFSDHYVDGEDYAFEHCVYSHKISVAGSINKGGEEHYIIVSEVVSGHFLTSRLFQNYQGYVIVPELYIARASDSTRDIVVRTNHAFVSNHGEMMLFERP